MSYWDTLKTDKPQNNHFVWFHLYKIIGNANYFIVTETNSCWVHGPGASREEKHKGGWRKFGGWYIYIHYLNCGDNFTDV